MIDTGVGQFEPGIHRKLCAALYEWALNDFLREIDQDYPLLRQMAVESTWKFLSIESAWTFVKVGADRDIEAIKDIARLLVLSKHVDHAQYDGIEWLDDDKARVINWFRANASVMDSYYSKMDAIDLSIFKPLKLRTLMDSTLDSLTTVLGSNVLWAERDNFAISTSIPNVSPDWMLGTFVEFKAKHSTLKYEQSIYNANTGRIGRLHTFDHIVTNLLFSYGIGLTEYRAKFEDDLAPILVSLPNVCRHYLDAIPSILARLD
jgi:hypothetical protein